MRLLVGTSGFSYAPWKGTFYPADLHDDQMLNFYASKLGAVEINNTYYRMPAPNMLGEWSKQTPDSFAFILKAPRYIVPKMKPSDLGDPIAAFFDRSQVLGTKQGPTLVQIPPFYRKRDLPLLDDFLARFPKDKRIAIDFRHVAWYDDSVLDVLKKHNAALCVSDAEKLASPCARTTDWMYVRLRREEYTSADFERWATQIRDQNPTDVFVFFKHEDAGTGPRYAADFTRVWGP